MGHSAASKLIVIVPRVVEDVRRFRCDVHLFQNMKTADVRSFINSHMPGNTRMLCSGVPRHVQVDEASNVSSLCVLEGKACPLTLWMMHRDALVVAALFTRIFFYVCARNS